MSGESLGSGTYRVEIADAGSHGERGAVFTDVTDNVSSIRWRRELDKVSQAQVAIDVSPSCFGDVCRISTIVHELRIIRDEKIVWEGVIVRKETVRTSVNLVAFDLSWWLQRRFIPDGLLTGQALDVAELSRLIVTGSLGRLFNGESMDPAVVDLVRTANIGLFGSPSISGDNYRYAFEELQTWASTDLDWTMYRRSFLAGDPPVVARFGTLTLDQIEGLPKLIERGDLYATDVVTIGGDGKTFGFASVEDVLGVRVPAHLRSEIREVVEAVSDQTALTEIARSMIRLRYPSPVEITTGTAAWLSPKSPVCVEQLIPGATGTINVAGYCAKRVEQESEIVSVIGQVTSKGEKVGFSVRPVVSV